MDRDFIAPLLEINNLVKTIGEKIMFTKKIISLLVFTFIIFISATTEINAQETKSVDVDGKVKMVDTGVKIKKGDIVKITDVSGGITVSGSDPTKSKTYEGNINTVKSSDYFEYANAAEHSLVMWIGDKNKHQQVRKNIATEAETGGNLFLAFNDGKRFYDDNTGKFTVTFKVVSGDKVCSPPTSEKVNIKWINKTGKPIRVNWINFKCTEETSDRLIQPDGVFDGYSFVGHIFRVRDEDKNDIGVVTVEASSANINIVN